MKKNNNAITLLELLVAIPVFFVASMALLYFTRSMSDVAVYDMLRGKCQVAATNLLMMRKAGFTNLADLDATVIDQDTTNPQQWTIPFDHPAHPDRDSDDKITLSASITREGDKIKEISVFTSSPQITEIRETIKVNPF